MGILQSLFGKREKSSPEVRGVSLRIIPQEEEIVQGQLAKIRLAVKGGSTPLYLDFFQFHLINRREEKKAFLDKMVTSSRFIFRININRELQSGEETLIEMEFLPPICREGTRKTKFVMILWELQPSLYLSDPGSNNSRGSYRFVGENQELVIKGRR